MRKLFPFLIVPLLTSSCLVGENAAIQQRNGLGLKGNLPPVRISSGGGSGSSYQPSQLGGLSFTRYGEDNPSGNQVSHDEMMDFLDDPVGNADGYRADGTVAQQTYAFAGSSTPGWSQSAANDKYADGSGLITPVAGGDFFGDTYRGYFVPQQDGIYQFVNNVLPDNGVRVMMSPNECPQGAIAVISTDFAGRGWIGRTVGATDLQSTWIQGNGGAFGGIFGQVDNVYYHKTDSFYPLGLSDPNYANGQVYLKAGKIYYLEIRYSEGGGGNDFNFGIDRRDIGGGPLDGVTNLRASDMLPFSGADKYVVRQACGGAFQSNFLFTDPEGDPLTYSARLVNADGSALSGYQATLASIGLSIDPNSGTVTGTPNSQFTTQQMIITAVDLGGSNTRVDSMLIPIVK